MSKTHRVVFSFDERSLESLKKITEDGQYSSMAETVRDSVIINKALRDQVGQGYSEIVLRNPKTGEERVVVIPKISG
jgi:hypothetical protein